MAQSKHKRRTKKQPRCTMCTSFRWMGNMKERRPIRDRRQLQD